MPVRLASLVVTGPGGSGRTTALRSWVAETDRVRRAMPRVIDPAIESVSAHELESWHHATDTEVALAVDDVDQLDVEAHRSLARLARERVVAVVRGATASPDLDALVDRLIEGTPESDPAQTQRLGHLDDASVVSTFDIDAPAAAVLCAQTGGCMALVADAVRFGWDGDSAQIPPDLFDAVLRRLRRAGPEVLQVVRLASLGVGVAAATEIVDLHRPDAERVSATGVERRLAASGFLDPLGEAPRLAPLVVECARLDLTDRDRADLAGSIIDTAVISDPFEAARVQLIRPTTTPIERARAAVRLGHQDAAAAIAALPDVANPEVGALAFADDMRHLRLDRASSRRLPSEQPWPSVIGLALTMTGLSRAVGGQPPASTGDEVWTELEAALAGFLRGDIDESVTAALRVHDDAVRRGESTLAGITPSAIVAMLLLQAGRADRAHEVTRQALDVDLGGPGERRTHALVHALASMQLGDFSAALDLARPADRSTVSADTGRESLLAASVNAVIARRSGDTARLREAWNEAAPLLDRALETWLLADQLIDLAATGARVRSDDADRLLGRLTAQLDRLPPTGPGATMRCWAELQVDVAAERWPAVAEVPAVCQSDAEQASASDRCAARRRSRVAWANVARVRLGRVDRADGVVDAAKALAAVGDLWDASRLLGQAALDEPDPKIARELLEAARALVSEPVESTDRLVAAGLSEREAEVSRLVAEGHTYKEIGAQLYISPKTVEHHVAKIRQRLGVGSRAELLASIRELVA